MGQCLGRWNVCRASQGPDADVQPNRLPPGFRRGRYRENLRVRAKPVPGFRQNRHILARGHANDRHRPNHPAQDPHDQH